MNRPAANRIGYLRQLKMAGFEAKCGAFFMLSDIKSSSLHDTHKLTTTVLYFEQNVSILNNYACLKFVCRLLFLLKATSSLILGVDLQGVSTRQNV